MTVSIYTELVKLKTFICISFANSDLYYDTFSEGCDEYVENLFDKESCITVKCFSFKNETITVNKMSAHS